MVRIGVLTSGGDSPGMNACIRAVVRRGTSLGMEVWGIKRGFKGLINGEMEKLDNRKVGGIIQKGGTFLQTARCPEFKDPKVMREGLRRLNEANIEGLVIIGGDGSMRGAYALYKMGFPVVGVPASIDNDVWGTDMAIGVDTALNAVLLAIDRIKDTATSHGRAFLIEVMGRQSGYLALMGGLAGGAEAVLIPEKDTSLEEVASIIEDAYIKGKPHAIIVIAEGAKYKTHEVASFLTKDEVGFEVRTTILGHIQRGGSPTAFDRILATRFGVAAVEALASGQKGVMVALVGNKVELIPLEEVVSKNRGLDLKLLEMANVLAQ
ncbi:MAG: 6-phosphofructokinase [Anaerolineae bacterium]|nr:6-phosphofructokinase [Anaerolineae bacterium]MDW8103266.1 6-phosphofructokinase [Anaerolineae bacterium]